MKARLRYLSWAICLPLALAGTACASTGAPLSTTSDSIRVCGHADKDNYVGFGLGFIQNNSDKAVVVNKIELVDPHNLELMGADAIDVKAKQPRGVDFERAPIGQQDYQVGPGVEASISAVVRVVDPDQRGDTLGTKVHYTDGNGQSRDLQLDFKIIVLPAGQECDMENLPDRN